MILSTLAAALVAVSSAPPGVSAGPDLAERATLVDLPIDRVAVFSDRARVQRTGPVKLKAGSVVVRVPDLPGNTWLDTVRVSAQGATVIRVETQPVDRERYSIDQVEAWMVSLEDKGDELSRTLARTNLASAQLGLLGNLRAAPIVDEQHRFGKALPALNPVAWRATQDRIAERRSKIRVEQRKLELENRTLQKAISLLQREVSQRDLGGFSERKLQVVVILEATSARTGSVTLEYAVPGAFWKPAYDLHFDADAGTVNLEANGRVTQATGEDWENIQLAFSTAVPGRGIDMPELITWTLGDDREYIPRPTPRTSPRRVTAFAPPAPRPRIAELERAADRAILAQRTRTLIALASQAPVAVSSSLGNRAPPTPPRAKPRRSGYRQKTSIDFGDDMIEGELAKPEGDYLEERSRSMPQNEPMPVSVDSAPGFATSISRAAGAIGGMFAGEKDKVRSASMALLSGNAWARPVFGDRTLPAMTAGGFDYVFDAPVRASVPSQASGLRVPLAARSYKVSTFYEATPSLAETAYLKAVVKNGSRLPILAGPANIFVKGSFAGDAQLQTTGPGGDLELPLGADEDIRLTRTVIPETKTEGIFVKDDVTEYVVKIEIGNYKKKAVTVRVIDQVPKTNNEKIKIELLSAKPKAQKKPDADGLLYWHVDVRAGKTETVFFRYRITRPKDWRLYQ